MSALPHSAAIVDSVSCNGCGKLISLKDVAQWGLGNEADGYQCIDCRAIFQAARDRTHDNLSVTTVANRTTAEVKCLQCRKSHEELNFETRRQFNRDVRWFAQMKDGIWVSMCETCSDAFVRKQNLLYRGTRFEHVAKLRGNK